MHVEMSLEQEEEAQQESESTNPADTQTILGSQVACSFARMDEQKVKANTSSGLQTLMISVAAVMSVVGLYLIFVLLM